MLWRGGGLGQEKGERTTQGVAQEKHFPRANDWENISWVLTTVDSKTGDSEVFHMAIWNLTGSAVEKEADSLVVDTLSHDPLGHTGRDSSSFLECIWERRHCLPRNKRPDRCYFPPWPLNTGVEISAKDG